MSPRPTPIIVPGPSTFGSNFQQEQSEVNLTGLIKLLDATLGERAREKKRVSAGEAAARILEPAREAEQQRVITDPEGFGTNFPDRPATEAGATLGELAQAPLGRKTLFDMLKTGGVEGQDELFSTPRMYQNEEDEYRVGFFNKQGEMVKDIRKATDKEVKGTLRITLEGLQRSTKGKLERDIISANTNIAQFNEIENLYDPSYLTYQGKSLSWLQRLGEKTGMKFDAEYLENRTRWFQQAQMAFLEWRKWVTGVAGGEKEMVEIAKSFPDPERNSPTEFKANLDQARIWTRKLEKRLKAFREMGVQNPTKKQLSGIPLDMINLQEQIGGEVTYNPETGELN